LPADAAEAGGPTPAGPPLLEALGLGYDHPGGIPGLVDVSVRIRQGSRLAILGGNGAGKTTFLLHLVGLLRPGRGEIRLDGRPVGYRTADLGAWRQRVGLVFQDPNDQLFAATVAEDVSFGPLNLGLAPAAVRARVAETLDALGIADLAARPTHMLSLGQKKRVAIAGLLAMRPDVLLLDEPTAGLDADGSDRLLARLARLHAAGTTLVIATHDVELAHAWADEAVVFEGGRVTAAGPAAAVLADADALARARLRPPLGLELDRLRRAAAAAARPA
jgi:cobalt/nickel transport system ATP-binding protein